MKDLKKIFDYTKNIAVVGLSPNQMKASHIVAKYMQSNGFKIIPIYPKEDKILGQRVYRSLDEVKEKIDIVNMFRRSDFADILIEQISKRDDVKCLWLQLGIENENAKQQALKLNLDFVQNKCIMVEHERLANDSSK